MSEPAASVPPPHHDKLSERLKHLPALIAAFTALVTAIAAFRKPPDTTASKAGYEELARALKEVSQGNMKNHEDIVALHAYLKAYAEVLATMKQGGPQVAALGSSGPRVGEVKAGAGKGRRPATTEAEKPATKPAPPPEAAVRTPAPAAPAGTEKADLPPLAEEPRLVVPRSFKAVMDDARTGAK